MTSEHLPYEVVKRARLIDGVCEFCVGYYGDKGLTTQEGLALLSEAQGHPTIARFVSQGYQIIFNLKG